MMMQARIGAILLLVATGSLVALRPAPKEGPDPRRALFVRRGCTACHAISGLGLTAEKDVAPDLTLAYVDVGTRYGVSLESFLDDPSGVMRLMLASHLHLSAADRDSIVHVLHGLYLEHRAELRWEILPPGMAGSK